MEKKKKQRRKRGDLVKINLGDGHLAFAQVLENPLFAFFDLRATEVPPLKEILEGPVAFSVLVMKYAVTKGRWEIIGNAEVAENIDEHPAFYKKDSISGELFITFTGAEEEPATLEETEDLECAAVWDPEHVEDRLNDHFLGRPCKWLIAQKERKATVQNRSQY